MPAYDHSNLIRYAVADHVEEQHEEMGYSPKFRRGWSSSSVHYVFVMLGLAFCFAWINVFPTSFSSDKKMTPPFMHEREQESSFVLNKILGSLRFLVERPRCSLLLYSCGKKVLDIKTNWYAVYTTLFLVGTRITNLLELPIRLVFTVSYDGLD